MPRKARPASASSSETTANTSSFAARNDKNRIKSAGNIRDARSRRYVTSKVRFANSVHKTAFINTWIWHFHCNSFLELSCKQFESNIFGMVILDLFGERYSARCARSHIMYF